MVLESRCRSQTILDKRRWLWVLLLSSPFSVTNFKLSGTRSLFQGAHWWQYWSHHCLLQRRPSFPQSPYQPLWFKTCPDCLPLYPSKDRYWERFNSNEFGLWHSKILVKPWRSCWVFQSERDWDHHGTCILTDMQGALKFHFWLLDVIPAAIRCISDPTHIPKLWIDKHATDVRTSIRKGGGATICSTRYLPDLAFPREYKMEHKLFKYEDADLLTSIISSTLT